MAAPDDDAVYRLIKQDLAEFPDKTVICDTQAAWKIIAGQMCSYERVYMDIMSIPRCLKS